MEGGFSRFWGKLRESRFARRAAGNGGKDGRNAGGLMALLARTIIERVESGRVENKRKRYL